MSDSFLFIIPADPMHMPDENVRQAVLEKSTALYPDSDAIELRIHEHPEFISGYENFETVRCPACKTEIFDWWVEAFRHLVENDPDDLRVMAPCCGAISSVDRLDYDLPQGFARHGYL